MLARFLVFLALASHFPARLGQAQTPPSPVSSPPVSSPPVSMDDERSVSWRELAPNVASDQKRVWTFPARLVRGKYLVPTLAVLATTGALIATDPSTGRYFRRTDKFSGFNSAFSSTNTSLGMVAAPVALYAAGLVTKDSYAQRTALLAGEAVADSEILVYVLKNLGRRARPADIAPNGDFSDTWTDGKGKLYSGKGSFPSGHTIVAFSIATVVARRYGNHRWVPFVAYGLAATVGVSRMTLSAHFPSDVFMGAALGYSMSRFAVLHQ